MRQIYLLISLKNDSQKVRAEPRAVGESSTIKSVMNILTNRRRWRLMRGRKRTEHASVQKNESNLSYR